VTHITSCGLDPNVVSLGDASIDPRPYLSDYDLDSPLLPIPAGSTLSRSLGESVQSTDVFPRELDPLVRSSASSTRSSEGLSSVSTSKKPHSPQV